MTTTTRVAVLGAAGRMGRTVCEAIEDAADLDLVAAVEAGDDVTALAGRADVAVDFTVPGATEGNVHDLIDAGVHAVVGTTGWDETSLDRVRQHLERTGNATGVLVAANFSLSAVLAMRFAAQAAAYFESVEIIELHHPAKVDAPSGTALATARAVSAAREAAGLGVIPDATEIELAGARGARVEGVPVHSVRLRGLLAHEEILLGNAGEQLTIRTDCVDRVSFMPGVLLAVRRIACTPGLTVGLEQLIEL